MRGGAQRSNLRPSNSRSNQNQRGGKDDANTEHLLAHEVDILKEQFFVLDKQNVGFLQQHELRTLLEYCGEKPSEDKLSAVERWVEEQGFRRLDQNSCLQAWNHLKELNQREEEEHFDYDILNAFVAMGGNHDKTGAVKRKKLEEIIIEVFELVINLDEMFEEAGLEIDEELNFYEFTCLLESGGTQRASRICSIFSVA